MSSIMRCWSGVMVCSLTVSSLNTSSHAGWSLTSRVSAHHGGSQDREERIITLGRPDRPETAATAASSNYVLWEMGPFEADCHRLSSFAAWVGGRDHTTNRLRRKLATEPFLICAGGNRVEH